MRWTTVVPFVFGLAVLLFGLYLVSTGGSVGKTYLPSLIGLPNCKTDPNASSCASASFIGYGPGTIVCLFGLGLLASAARTATARAGRPSYPTVAPGTMPPIPYHLMPTTGPTVGPQPGVKYCPKCARANATDAGFCQQCGSTMPPAS